MTTSDGCNLQQRAQSTRQNPDLQILEVKWFPERSERRYAVASPNPSTQVSLSEWNWWRRCAATFWTCLGSQVFLSPFPHVHLGSAEVLAYLQCKGHVPSPTFLPLSIQYWRRSWQWSDLWLVTCICFPEILWQIIFWKLSLAMPEVRFSAFNCWTSFAQDVEEPESWEGCWNN